MSLRFALIASAAVLMASPSLAASRKSPDPILNHSGPISYEELQQIDPGTGYNARSKTGHHKHMLFELEAQARLGQRPGRGRPGFIGLDPRIRQRRRRRQGAGGGEDGDDPGGL